MRGSRKFCQREFNSENIFFFGWRRVGGSIYHFKQVIIGPPAKHHLNGVLLVCLWRPNIEHGLVALWFFKWSGPVLLRNLIFLWFFRGPDCLAPPPLWIRTCHFVPMLHGPAHKILVLIAYVQNPSLNPYAMRLSRDTDQRFSGSLQLCQYLRNHVRSFYVYRRF